MSKTAAMRTPSSLSKAVAGLVLFALSAACDSPTQPSPSRPEPSRTDPSGQAPPPLRTYLDIAGMYTLTLSASSRCRLELPEDLRTRSFPATIVQRGGSLTVTVLHSRYPGWVNGRFSGEFGETNDVIFQLGLEDWWPPDGGSEYSATGSVTSTISAGGLSGSLNGSIGVSVFSEGYPKCTAPDHGVVFSR